MVTRCVSPRSLPHTPCSGRGTWGPESLSFYVKEEREREKEILLPLPSAGYPLAPSLFLKKENLNIQFRSMACD